MRLWDLDFYVSAGTNEDFGGYQAGISVFVCEAHKFFGGAGVKCYYLSVCFPPNICWNLISNCNSI